MTLPAPKVVTCFFDVGFIPPVATMQLLWPSESREIHHWTLPSGEKLTGPLPERFALRVRRQAEDAYAIALVWDSTYRQWFSLRRCELLDSSLACILTALGKPLESLLDQPIGSPERSLTSAA